MSQAKGVLHGPGDGLALPEKAPQPLHGWQAVLHGRYNTGDPAIEPCSFTPHVAAVPRAGATSAIASPPESYAVNTAAAEQKHHYPLPKLLVLGVLAGEHLLAVEALVEAAVGPGLLLQGRLPWLQAPGPRLPPGTSAPHHCTLASLPSLLRRRLHWPRILSLHAGGRPAEPRAAAQRGACHGRGSACLPDCRPAAGVGCCRSVLVLPGITATSDAASLPPSHCSLDYLISCLASLASPW
jgi:hypothetical protein